MVRMRGLLEKAAPALAGRAGSRLAAALGAVVSRFTLIRLVRALPDPEAGPVTVLGVDDVAERKGRSCATVLMEMDSHRLIDMGPPASTTWIGPAPLDQAGVPAQQGPRGDDQPQLAKLPGRPTTRSGRAGASQPNRRSTARWASRSDTSTEGAG